jgi:putative ABC transport system substrate-binding protein
MKRRTILQFCVTTLALPAVCLAQAERRFRIGLLWLADEPLVRPFHTAFVRGLQERGYSAGRNLVLDVRHAGGDSKRLPGLIDELLSSKPDVLIGIEQVAVAMKAKTASVPIVVPAGADLVAAGLVESLSRPGTNVTGIANLGDQLVAKQMELLAEITPKMTRVAFLGDPLAPSAGRSEEFARNAAAAKGLTMIATTAADPKGVVEAFSILARERAEGVVVASTGRINQLRKEIIAELRRLRLPSICGLPAQAWAEEGGLITYAADFLEVWRYSAALVDRIFRGARPADIPVEQVAKFEFVLNLKVARELGLTVPQRVLLRANRVIE